jgi:anthranilate phosphoribosyltransferase
MQDLVAPLVAGQELSGSEINMAVKSLLDPMVSAVEKADFLSALSKKGETCGEITAFARALLSHAVEPNFDRAQAGRPLLDVCGTGGDHLDLFNVSTTSVFLLAACGVAVVKHGNRAITSKSGGADVLEALGIRIDLGPEEFGNCLEEVGAGFLFAPRYHPAFAVIAPVRKELATKGQRTVFNLLGPLLNPARPDYQLVGICRPELGETYREILTQLGRDQAWVVSGTTADGASMDEISNLGPTKIWKTGETTETILLPLELGIVAACLQDVQGGDAAANAALVIELLRGKETGPKRDLVCLNAAAGLQVTGQAGDWAEGLAKANEAINSGAALDVLRRWQNFSG